MVGVLRAYYDYCCTSRRLDPCFSPAHCSFQRLVDEWAAVVAPWSRIPVLLLATRIDLLAIPEVHMRLKERGLTAISQEEALSFASNFAVCREAPVKLFAVAQCDLPSLWVGQQMKHNERSPTPLLHKSCKEVFHTLQTLLNNNTAGTGKDVAETDQAEDFLELIVRDGQWDEVVSDMIATYAERSLIPECVVDYWAPYAVRQPRDRSMELTMPMNHAIAGCC